MKKLIGFTILCLTMVSVGATGMSIYRDQVAFEKRARSMTSNACQALEDSGQEDWDHCMKVAGYYP